MSKLHNTPLVGINNPNISKSTFFAKIFFFFALYLLLIAISPLLLMLVLYRAILVLFFGLRHKGKFQLLNGADAFTTAGDRYANVCTITFTMLVKEECDIHSIRDRVKTSILRRNKHGQRPFEKLLKSTVKKYGFIWWEDKSDQMNFSNHIKYCPDADDLQKVYSERETMAAIAKLNDAPWNDERPRWEFVIVPKVKREDESEGEYYCIALRISHSYVDGISTAQFIRHCLFDQPSPKLTFDPVNPPIPPLPFYQKVILYLQAFFMGPYDALLLAGCKEDPVFSEGTLTGEKFYRRLKMDLSLAMMRRIRKAHNCDTQAVLHSTLTGAMETMAMKKGLPVSEAILGFVPHARYPYPDEYPCNGAVFTLEQLEMKISDPVERLARVNLYVKRNLKEKAYKMEVAYMFMTLYGLLPVAGMDLVLRSAPAAYIISNVPGIDGKGRVNGSDVEVLTGFTPMVNTFRYAAGVGCYNGRFIIGFSVGKTKVIANEKDMDEFILAFEKAIRRLDC